MNYFLLFFLTFQVLINGIVSAQHGEAESGDSHNKSHIDHTHWNHIAVFAGATSKFGKEGTHFTLGFDYLRKMPPTAGWTISVFGEAIFEDHIEWLFGIPVFFGYMISFGSEPVRELKSCRKRIITMVSPMPR